MATRDPATLFALQKVSDGRSLAATWAILGQGVGERNPEPHSKGIPKGGFVQMTAEPIEGEAGEPERALTQSALFKTPCGPLIKIGSQSIGESLKITLPLFVPFRLATAIHVCIFRVLTVLRQDGVHQRAGQIFRGCCFLLGEH